MSTTNCWNCQYEIHKGDKICRRCEADQTEQSGATPEDLAEAMELAEASAPGTLDELQAVAGQHATAEDFANAILVGNCPKCEGNNVGDCEHDPDYNDPFLGRCFNCATVWCTECRHILEKDEQCCPNQAEHFAAPEEECD